MTAPTARRRKDPHERAGEIRAAAVSLAGEQGLAALTLRAIAERAGVTPALVAHYIDGMESLVAEVFAEIVGAELGELRPLITGTPAHRLALLFATVLGDGRDDVTLVWVEAWAQARRNAALAAAIEEQMDAWHAFVAGIIEDGSRAGDFTTGDPDAVAWELLGMLDGLAAHALARGTDPAPFIQRLARAGEVLVGAEPGSISAA